MDRRGYEGLTSAAAAKQVAAVHVPEVPQTFFCQLAHGGPTAVIPTPNNLTQVYEAIASKFDGMSPDDILYCTVNTFKPEMDHLLTSNLKVNDFIFAHVHGTRKEVTLTKTDAMLGVTLTDNGYGKVFIKRIHSDSVVARSQPAVLVGDHIEKVNGQKVIGTRHYTVAAMLRAIPLGESFTLRVVEPRQSSFSFVGAAPSTTTLDSTNKVAPEDVAPDGNQALRFSDTGNAVMQEAPSQAVVDKINSIFETYLGFNDDVLALAGWEIASKAKNFVDLKDLFIDSDLGGFGFPDELLFDIWGTVDDFRNKRIAADSASASDEPDETQTPNDSETAQTDQQRE